MNDRRPIAGRLSLPLLAIALALFCASTLRAQTPVPAKTAAPVGSAEANQQPAHPDRRPAELQRSDLGSEMFTAVIGALAGALLGGVFGWKASIGAVNAADALSRVHEKEQAENLRRMLRAEIDFNLSSLAADQEWRKDLPQNLLPGQWVALHPAPSWSTVVWQNSVLMLAKSLKSEEVLPVHRFYTSLRALTAARQTLEIVWRESLQPQNDYIPSYNLVMQLESAMLQTKNPISPT